MPRRTIFISDYPTVVRQGRGQGSGSDYRPGLEVRDTASQATSTRLWSAKLGRMVHLLSNGELEAFLQFEHLANVVDIREQFFLDPDVTQEICRELKLIHPNVRGRPVVMTTDFVVTRREGEKRWTEAYQVKRREADLTPRMRAKLKVEYLYWTRKNVPWRILYSEEFNPALCRNLKGLHAWRGRLPSKDDTMMILQVFRYAKKCYGDRLPGDIPVAPVELRSGVRLSFRQCLETLAANRLVEFPIRAIPLGSCPVGRFTEMHGVS